MIPTRILTIRRFSGAAGLVKAGGVGLFINRA